MHCAASGRWPHAKVRVCPQGPTDDLDPERICWGCKDLQTWRYTAELNSNVCIVRGTGHLRMVFIHDGGVLALKLLI